MLGVAATLLKCCTFSFSRRTLRHPLLFMLCMITVKRRHVHKACGTCTMYSYYCTRIVVVTAAARATVLCVSVCFGV